MVFILPPPLTLVGERCLLAVVALEMLGMSLSTIFASGHWLRAVLTGTVTI